MNKAILYLALLTMQMSLQAMLLASRTALLSSLRLSSTAYQVRSYACEKQEDYFADVVNCLIEGHGLKDLRAKEHVKGFEQTLSSIQESSRGGSLSQILKLACGLDLPAYVPIILEHAREQRVDFSKSNALCMAQSEPVFKQLIDSGMFRMQKRLPEGCFSLLGATLLHVAPTNMIPILLQHGVNPDIETCCEHPHDAVGRTWERTGNRWEDVTWSVSLGDVLPVNIGRFQRALLYQQFHKHISFLDKNRCRLSAKVMDDFELYNDERALEHEAYDWSDHYNISCAQLTKQLSNIYSKDELFAHIYNYCRKESDNDRGCYREFFFVDVSPLGYAIISRDVVRLRMFLKHLPRQTVVAQAPKLKFIANFFSALYPGHNNTYRMLHRLIDNSDA